MPNQTMAQMLLEQRKKLEARFKEILERAESEKRDLSTEEGAHLDQISTDMDGLLSRSNQLVKFDQDQRDMDEALRAAGHKGHEDRGGDGSDLMEQFRSLANRSRQEVAFVPTKDELRALSKGTAAAGGNTVPTTFIARLLEHMIETATLLRAGATTITTSSGENMEMPVTTSHGTAALVAEAGVIGGTDPVFGKRTLGAFKYGELILVPNELLTDTAVDLDGYLARMAGRAVGNALGAHLITGTGTGQPTGIFTSTTLGATTPTGTSGAPTFDTMIDLLYSVIGPYRNSPDAAWLIKDTTSGTLRKLKDTNGRYLWEPSVVPGTPDTILGHPVQSDPNVVATGLNNKSVAFGDLSTYVVRLVNSIRFERSDDFKFDTDVVAFRCLVRGDGLLLDQSGAVKHIVGAAT